MENLKWRLTVVDVAVTDAGVEVSVNVVAGVVVGRAVWDRSGRGAAPTTGSCGKGARFLRTRFMWRFAWPRC